MEEGAHEGRSIYRPMKVIVWPGVSLHFRKELVSLLVHFPFASLPSVAAGPHLCSTEEARDIRKGFSVFSRTGFEPSAALGKFLLAPILWNGMTDWYVYSTAVWRPAGTGPVCGRWSLETRGSWYAESLVLSVALNFLPCGCELPARCTVPSLLLCDPSEFKSGIFPRWDLLAKEGCLCLGFREGPGLLLTIVTKMPQNCFSNNVILQKRL